MGKRHNKQDAHRFPAPGAHPHVSDLTQEIPRFKHAAKYQAPRYSPLLCLAWGAALFIAIIRFVQGINGPDIERWAWHYVVDGFVGVALLIVVSFLWNAWEREERYPQLLPKREFERRYPPGPGSGPCEAETNATRPYHRQIPYVEDVTATGSVYSEERERMRRDGFDIPGEDRCG